MKLGVKTLISLAGLSLGIIVANPVLGQGRANQGHTSQERTSQSVRINSDTSLLIAADFDKFLSKLKSKNSVLHQVKACQNRQQPHSLNQARKQIPNPLKTL